MSATCSIARTRPTHWPLVLMLAALAGCDGSGDGAEERSVTLYFETNNIRACMPITVDVDLAAASAELERRDDGSLDCTLDTALAADGCTGVFAEIAGGSTLEAIIDGCEVPEIASLFECVFSQANAGALAASTDAVCDCVGEPECFWNVFCLRRPAICVSEQAGPGACEDCFNGEDDDGDGFVDCDDSDCFIADCGIGQTTITCSTTVTTTTTSVTSTSVVAGAVIRPPTSREARLSRRAVRWEKWLGQGASFFPDTRGSSLSRRRSESRGHSAHRAEPARSVVSARWSRSVPRVGAGFAGCRKLPMSVGRKLPAPGVLVRWSCS